MLIVQLNSEQSHEVEALARSVTCKIYRLIKLSWLVMLRTEFKSTSFIKAIPLHYPI